MRAVLLAVDGLALVGVVAFSALVALDSDKVAYMIGQIVCAALILGSALLLNRSDSYPDE